MFGLAESHLPPSNFWPALLLYHAFPLHAPLTTFVFDAPFGRFASKASRFNLNGNIAWSCMEIVAPVTFLLTLYRTPHPSLSGSTTVLITLFLTHYAHRAVLSPLLLSPTRSPLHPVVAAAMGATSLLNGYVLAIGLALDPYPVETTTRFWLCVAGWTLGFLGNVYHDEILNDLRRPPGQRLVSHATQEEKGDQDAGGERYKIPRGGLYGLVSFPNYLCEWFEWTCFAIAASPRPFILVPPLASLDISPSMTAVLNRIGWWPTHLLSPPWMFLVFLVSAMLPRAIRGHRWYKKTFGDRYPANRKAVFPWLL